MLRSSNPRPTARRRAAILLITIVLLMLFLVIGMCFLVFAEAQATSSRIYREASLYLAENRYPTPEEMFGFALGEIIYDVPDDPATAGPYSAIRGHSLARNMYGWNYDATGAGSHNETPFNGSGRLSTGAGTYMNPFGVDDKPLINYMYWPSDGFKRDPERNLNSLYTGGANVPYTYPDLNNVYLAAVRPDPANPNSIVPQVLIPSFWRGNHTGFGPLDRTNPNWWDPTAAAARLKYLTLRPRPADQLTAAEIAAGANSATVQAMEMAKTIFPAPATPFGDVTNLPGGAQPDSVWVDLGFQPRFDASNRKFKPMFAILIVDLDGRVNINVAGNVRETAGNGYSGSNSGIGPWEINPTRLMEDVANPFGPPATFARLGKDTQYLDLFRGNALAGGRFGQKPNMAVDYPPFGTPPNFPVPNATNLTAAVPGNAALNYAPVDVDASSVIRNPPGGGARQQIAMPGPNSFQVFPTFPGYYQSGNADERYYHPSLFNPFQLNRLPSTPSPVGPEADRYLPVADMQKLLAWTTPLLPAGLQPANPPFPISPDTRNSKIGQLWCLPDYSGNLERYPKLRQLITTHSMDMDRAGTAPGQPINAVAPFAATPSPYVLDITQPPGATRIPSAAASAAFNDGTPNSLLPNRAGVPNPGGDLRNADWRSALGDLGRVNLNRKLTDYPAPPQPGYRLDMTNMNVVTQFNNATRDRQMLASDIFDRLRLAAGAEDPATFAGADPTAGPSRPQFEALRYLAQLAVNIVDYIDADDVITSFNMFGVGSTQAWGWVFGTEMPRLVINEVYAQVQNDPDDQFGTTSSYAPGATFDPDTPFTRMGDPFLNVLPVGSVSMAMASSDYRVNFFVELYNPHKQDQNLTPFELPANAGAARLQLADPTLTAGQPRNVYKIIIRSQVDPAAMRDPKNVAGDPISTVMTPNIDTQVADFESDAAAAMGVDSNLVLPATGASAPYGDQAANSQKNNGYYVLGPATQASTSTTRTPPNWQAAFPSDRKANPAAPFMPTVSVKDQTIDYTAVGGTSVTSRLYATLPKTLDPNGIKGMPDYQPTVVLQRLANPLLPPNFNPAAAQLYNPYITVDYLEKVPINDAVLFDGTTAGPRNTTGTRERQPLNADPTTTNNRVAVGRRQPFRAADVSAQSATSALSVANTFFTQNGGSVTAPGTAGTALDTQFEWLVHFDRKVINPMDLLYVSTYKPHELTQQFIPAGAGPNPATNLAHQQILSLAVRNPATRLFRGLEMMGTQSWMHGVPFGGRIPGKININTVWPDTASGDSLVLRCLADSYENLSAPDIANNAFTQTQAETVFRNFLLARTPGTIPMPGDQPMWSLGIPNPSTPDLQYPPPVPPGAVTNKTLLNPGFSPAALAAAHPYMKEDLLRKIYNNITTRSNVFAVYVTTGFFYVRDDSTLPVKLGAEIDPLLRHKMFAIVDRTNLSLGDALNPNPSYNRPRIQAGRPIYFPMLPINPGAAGVQGNLSVNANQELNFAQTVAAGQIIETTVPAYSFVGAGPNGVLTIRDTIDHYGQEFSATSGESFQIQVGTMLYVDVGDPDPALGPYRGRMEPVIVREVHPPIAGDPNNPLALSTIKIQALSGNFAFPHHMGCSICTQRIGNPGPQPLPLDYDAPPYSNTVVPFRMILQ